jgi:ankyrin repeat protein
LLGNPPDFPNCRGPRGVEEIILEYAIYHSPIAFVRTLLEVGADPNYEDNAGFPSLLAALSSQRPETYAIVELLSGLARMSNKEGKGQRWGMNCKYS